jgi:hypothetical protein
LKAFGWQRTSRKLVNSFFRARQKIEKVSYHGKKYFHPIEAVCIMRRLSIFTQQAVTGKTSGCHGYMHD